MALETTVPVANRKSLYWFLIFAVLFSLQVLPRLTQDSLVGDENLDIVDGFYYWQGDVTSTAEHPPLAKALQALPLRFMGLRSPTGLQFRGIPIRDAYFLSVLNRDHFGQIVLCSRLVSFLFGLGLGFLLFLSARKESSAYLLTLLTLWAFEPSFLAYSGFALSDLPITFFFFAAVWQFTESFQSSSKNKYFWVGILTAMAVTTKFTALLLIPVFFAIELQQAFSEQKGSFSSIFQRWKWGSLGAFLWVGLVYFPGVLATPTHPLSWTLFVDGVQSISHSFSHFYYFRGHLSQDNHWDYYPIAFLLKSPLPFLIFFLMAVVLFVAKIIRLDLWQWLPILFFFSAFLFFHDVGLRMILPVYPFCLLIAAKAGDRMGSRPWPQEKALPMIWAALLIFQVVSVGKHRSAQVSYFNELVPSVERRYWLGDSNLDFGQDTKRLAEAAKAKGWQHIKLAYFGTDDPRLYGMSWAYWTEKDEQAPQSGWVYVVNDEFLQIGPAYAPSAAVITKGWITQRPPDGRIGDTWSYYEIPGNIQKDRSPMVMSAPYFIDSVNLKP